MKLWSVGDRAKDVDGEVWRLRQDGWCYGDVLECCSGDHELHGMSTEELVADFGPIVPLGQSGKFTDVDNLLAACATLDTESGSEGRLGTSVIRHLLDGQPLDCYDPSNIPTRYLPMSHNPQEPEEFGARVTVTLSDGTREKWLRRFGTEENIVSRWVSHTPYGLFSWEDLCSRGTVTLGWEDEQ